MNPPVIWGPGHRVVEDEQLDDAAEASRGKELVHASAFRQGPVLLTENAYRMPLRLHDELAGFAKPRTHQQKLTGSKPLQVGEDQPARRATALPYERLPSAPWLLQ